MSSSTVVIALRGTPSRVIVRSESVIVTPFVGADHGGPFAQLGIGFVTESDQASFWGLPFHTNVLQSWRAMKIFEFCASEVDSATLCACWYAAGVDPTEHDRKAFAHLAEQVGGSETFELMRTRVLGFAPSSADLDAMLGVFVENKVEVDVQELLGALYRGIIPNTSAVAETLVVAEERLLERRRVAKEVEEPVQKAESLSAFFAELGIDNLCDEPVGEYGFDWTHFDTEEADKSVKACSIGPRGTDGMKLLRTTKGPESREYGNFEEPYYVADDGTVFTFVSAKWEEGHFLLQVRIARLASDPVEGLLTIADVRGMIRDVKKSVFAKFAAALKAFFGLRG